MPQYIKPSTDDSVLEVDSLRGSEHYLTMEVRHPHTGETLDKLEVVDLEQRRRDALTDAIQNKSEYRDPVMFDSSRSVNTDTRPDLTANVPELEKPANEPEHLEYKRVEDTTTPVTPTPVNPENAPNTD